MTPYTLFVNTSGWLAVYNPADPNHDAAVRLWESLRDKPVSLVTTDYVLDQVYTTFKIFGSLEGARAFHDLVESSSVVRIFMTDSVIFDRAWGIFMEDEQPQWSFTDCINYAVIQYLGISDVFTFDPSFAAPGLTIVPGLAVKESV